MTAPLRVACLGAGYFAQFHLEAWHRIPGAELIAVADHDPARAAAAGVTPYADLEAMMQAQSPDILDIILTPPGHAPAIRAALPYRPRAIICQKPFATSAAEAATLTAEAEAAGVPLIIHENIRFQPWYRCMKQAIHAGQIGAPLNATFRFRTGDGQGPDAYLTRQPYFQTMPRLLIHETGVHWIDTFRYLLGDAQGLYADLRRLNPVIVGEDAGHLILDYDDGKRALFDGNRLLDHDTNSPRRTFGEALVEGTTGTLTLTGDGAVTLRAKGAQTYETLLPAADYPGFAGDCVHALQSHVVAALNGQGALENTARDYLWVRRAEEAAYASAQTRTRVAL